MKLATFPKEILLKLRSLAVSCMLLLLCSLAAIAQPQMQSFSADMKTTGHKGEDMTGKFFFSGPDRHIRMDMATHGQNVSILADAGNATNPKTTMIMHDRRMYMEMNGAGPGMRQKTPQVRVYDPNNPCSVEEGTTCKKVGTETVDGHPCDKWEFTGKDAQTVWIAQDLHFPIKTQHADGSTIEFTNIKPGPQDASVFQVPAGYQKFDMGAMMGGHNPNQ
jgi:outer membrane lipoprotein-sorting protein